MSRDFEGDDGEDEQWQYALWQGRKKKAMNGRPALASFRALEAALLALPERRLIEGEVCNASGEVCAVGALALHQRVQAGEWRVRALASLYEEFDGGGVWDTAQLGKRYGMTLTLAWIIGDKNDQGGHRRQTPEERYTAMLEWTRAHIARLEAKLQPPTTAKL